MATFTAAFTGTICACCDEKICEGDEVTYDVTNRLIHAVCPETLDALAEQATFCPECHMMLPKSGECGYC